MSKNLDDFSRCDGDVLASTNSRGSFEVVDVSLPVRPRLLINGIEYSDLVIMDDGAANEIKLECALPPVIVGHFEDRGACFVLKAKGG